MWIEGVYSPGSGRVFAVMYPRGTFPTALDFLTTGRYGHGAKDGGGPDGSSSGGGNGGNGVTVTHTPSGDIVVIGSGGRQGNQTVATYRDEHVEVVRRMRLAQFAMSGMLPPSYEGFGYHEDTRTGVLPKQYCLLKLYGIVELQRRGAAGNGTSAAGDGSSLVDGGDDVNNPGIHEGIDYSRMMYPSDLVRGTLGGGGGAAGRGYAEREPGLMTMTSVAFSPDCHVAIDVDATAIEIAAFGAKVSNYVTMVMIVSLAQVYVLVRQAESMSTQAGAAKLSLFSIGMMALIDAYLCLFQLSSAVLAPFAFSSFMIAVFLKFVIFSIFEMRVMIAIWKVRRGPGDPDALYFVLLFSRFYLVLASGFFLVFWLQQYFYLILLALYSFWVPQVWHSVRNNVRRPHEPRFVAVMSLTRLAIPLYFTGCPSNFYGFHSSPAFALTLVAWVVAQGTLVILQGIWGPRFFVPRRFVPDSYDYRYVKTRDEKDRGIFFFLFYSFETKHTSPPSATLYILIYKTSSSRVPLRDLDEMELGNVATDGSGGNDCVICMMEISAEHVSTGATMLTPCGHMFHGACLERWMEIKLECPTCRSALPPV
jgi:hypothetical protein